MTLQYCLICSLDILIEYILIKKHLKYGKTLKIKTKVSGQKDINQNKTYCFFAFYISHQKQLMTSNNFIHGSIPTQQF